MSKKILIIVTSNAQLGDSGKTTGVWAEELIAPYYQFKAAGIEVSIASVRGGAVPFDGNSLKSAGQNEPEIERFLADPVAQRAVQNSVPLASVEAGAFDALYFPGGHGTMWDLPTDPVVQQAVETAWSKGQVVAAVCHGLAGLLSARRGDGQSILAGKRVNGFTDEEEHAAGLAEVVPFLLESKLRELGAMFERGPMWAPYAVRDGQLITGQNPASSARVAELVLQALAE